MMVRRDILRMTRVLRETRNGTGRRGEARLRERARRYTFWLRLMLMKAVGIGEIMIFPSFFEFRGLRVARSVSHQSS